MRRYTFRDVRDDQYEAAIFSSGHHLVAPTDPPGVPVRFSSLDEIAVHFGAVQISWIDPPEGTANDGDQLRTEPKPCPLPDGDCTTPPDVVTGGLESE